MIDVSKNPETCSRTSFFGEELVGTAGALVNDIPIICGGRHTHVSSAINRCSILKHGRFVRIAPKMPEKRFNSAAIGSISIFLKKLSANANVNISEFKGKLLVTGGRTPIGQNGSNRYL